METRCALQIIVMPKSSRQRIIIDASGQLKVYLTSPPVEGKANAELIKLLSRTLKMPKSNFEILRGQKSKNKTIALAGMTRNEAIEKIRESEL